MAERYDFTTTGMVSSDIGFWVRYNEAEKELSIARLEQKMACECQQEMEEDLKVTNTALRLLCEFVSKDSKEASEPEAIQEMMEHYLEQAWEELFGDEEAGND